MTLTGLLSVTSARQVLRCLSVTLARQILRCLQGRIALQACPCQPAAAPAVATLATS